MDFQYVHDTRVREQKPVISHGERGGQAAKDAAWTRYARARTGEFLLQLVSRKKTQKKPNHNPTETQTKPKGNRVKQTKLLI